MKSYKSEEILRIRNALKLTQEKFGELTGASIDAVYSWECGRRNPSWASCLLIEQLECRMNKMNEEIMEYAAKGRAILKR